MKFEDQNTGAIAETAKSLPDSTRIEYAELTVRDLLPSLHFYKDLVGLREAWSRGESIALSASADGTPVVLLTQNRSAQERQPHSAGLFHLALLYPTRRDLAAAFMRGYEQGWQFHGFADHGVSEALYLSDAEGNGVELYVDKPRNEWPERNGALEMVSDPLNIENLLAELKRPTQPETTEKLRVGHIHLQVTNLQSAEAFYNNSLGFAVTQRSYPGALFVAAGGYHHHIGLNVWNSRGGSPSRQEAAGLLRFGIRVGSRDAFDTLSQRLQDRKSVV